MAKVKTKDTDLEIAVRSVLHRRGFRFQKHVKGLPGKPDIVFTKAKVAVFVDGDFWHGYDFEELKTKISPFWQEKIAGNIKRDERNFAALREIGWQVVRVWKHEIKKDLNGVIDRITEAVRPENNYTDSGPLSDNLGRPIACQEVSEQVKDQT